MSRDLPSVHGRRHRRRCVLHAELVLQDHVPRGSGSVVHCGYGEYSLDLILDLETTF